MALECDGIPTNSHASTSSSIRIAEFSIKQWQWLIFQPMCRRSAALARVRERGFNKIHDAVNGDVEGCRVR